MLISRKLKLFATLGVASVTLASCSNTQMATTGLALVGTVLAVHTYNWVTNPDAETALGVRANKVFNNARKTIRSNNNYIISSTTKGNKESEIIAYAGNKEVKVVVENLGNNQSKIYIKDGRGKDQAQILLQQIMKNVK